MNSSTSSSDGERFLIRAAGLLIAMSLVLMGGNAFMDPFDLLHKHIIHGVNHFKTRTTGGFDRMSKAHLIHRYQPEVLLLGTSRVDWAMDPNHPALQALSTNVFNAGLAGATIYEVYRYLQHAHAIHPLKHVVIGLDLEMFDTDERRESYRDERMAVSETGRRRLLYTCRDLPVILYSLDAIEASFATHRESGRHTDLTKADLTQRGSDFMEIPPPDERWKLYQVGVKQARQNLSLLGRHWERIIDRMQWVDAILAFAHREHINLHLFISPYHRSHLDVIGKSYNWGAFEHWKRELVARNEVFPSPFPLWDFSGYHKVSLDPPPTKDHTGHLMTWYRESSHYRKVTADRILDRLFSLPTALPGFGLPLTAETIEIILNKQRYHRAKAMRDTGPAR